MDTYPGPNVQTVKDSSRYFVVKPIEGPPIGLGFAGNVFSRKKSSFIKIFPKNTTTFLYILNYRSFWCFWYEHGPKWTFQISTSWWWNCQRKWRTSWTIRSFSQRRPNNQGNSNFSVKSISWNFLWNWFHGKFKWNSNLNRIRIQLNSNSEVLQLYCLYLGKHKHTQEIKSRPK